MVTFKVRTSEPDPLLKAVGLYTDGGVVLKNPSDIGGSWAYRIVDSDDRLGGTVLKEFSGGRIQPGITNNTTEYIAAVLGFLALPEGWSGWWFPDSEVTVRRLLYGGKCEGLSTAQILWGNAARARLGDIKVMLLGGHPTLEDLKTGFRKKDKKAVSIHNVWCDRAARAKAIELQTLWERGIKQGTV